MRDQADELRELVRRSHAQAATGNGAAPRIVALSGGKGGVGTTTVAVNLGVALALSGRRVVLVDADLNGADCAALCQLEVRFSIADILSARHTVHEVLTLGPAGLLIVPGSWSPDEIVPCSPDAQDRLLAELRGLGPHADYVLIDSGSGMNRTVARFCQAADQLLMVTTPDPIAILDTYAAIKVLHNARSDLDVRTVVNLADAETADAVHARLDQVCQRFLGLGVPAAGHIPIDPQVPASRQAAAPLSVGAGHAPAARQIERLAESLEHPLALARTLTAVNDAVSHAADANLSMTTTLGSA